MAKTKKQAADGGGAVGQHVPRFRTGDRVTVTQGQVKSEGEVVGSRARPEAVSMVSVRLGDGQVVEVEEARAAPVKPAMLYRVKVLVSRHSIEKLYMDGRDLVLELDCSSSYELGYVHPLNLNVLTESGGVSSSHGVYVGQEPGDVRLSRPQ